MGGSSAHAAVTGQLQVLELTLRPLLALSVDLRKVFIVIILIRLNQSFSTQQSMILKIKIQGPFSIDYRERGSHAQSVYPTQDAPRMGTARMKQEEEADTRIIVIEKYEIWKKRNVGTKVKSPKQGLTSAKDLPIEIIERRESSTID